MMWFWYLFFYVGFGALVAYAARVLAERKVRGPAGFFRTSRNERLVYWALWPLWVVIAALLLGGCIVCQGVRLGWRGVSAVVSAVVSGVAGPAEVKTKRHC